MYAWTLAWWPKGLISFPEFVQLPEFRKNSWKFKMSFHHTDLCSFDEFESTQILFTVDETSIRRSRLSSSRHELPLTHALSRSLNSCRPAATLALAQPSVDNVYHSCLSLL